MSLLSYYKQKDLIVSFFQGWGKNQDFPSFQFPELLAVDLAGTKHAPTKTLGTLQIMILVTLGFCVLVWDCPCLDRNAFNLWLYTLHTGQTRRKYICSDLKK